MKRTTAALVLALSIGNSVCAAQNPETEQFGKMVGTWRLSYVINRLGSVVIGATSETKVVSPDSNTVSFAGNMHVGQGSFGAPQFESVASSLRWNPATSEYVFNLALGSPVVADMPMKYVVGTGFTGTGSIQLYRRPYDATVTVSLDEAKNEQVWLVSSPAGKSQFRFTFSK